MKGRAKYEVGKISSVLCVLHPQQLKKSVFILTKVLGISIKKYLGKRAFCRERHLFKKNYLYYKKGFKEEVFGEKWKTRLSLADFLIVYINRMITIFVFSV